MGDSDLSDDEDLVLIVFSGAIEVAVDEKARPNTTRKMKVYMRSKNNSD
jgi:hypothetical protein